MSAGLQPSGVFPAAGDAAGDEKQADGDAEQHADLGPESGDGLIVPKDFLDLKGRNWVFSNSVNKRRLSCLLGSAHSKQIQQRVF